jgi:hypothetical protein
MAASQLERHNPEGGDQILERAAQGIQQDHQKDCAKGCYGKTADPLFWGKVINEDYLLFLRNLARVG